MKQWKFRSRNSKSIRFRDFSTDFRKDSSRNPEININSHKLAKESKPEAKLKILFTDVQVSKDLQAKSLISFGAGKEGSLGIGSVEDCKFPMTINLFLHKTILQITCGAGNSLVLTADNQVYSWGFNSVGQLGLGHTRNCLSPCLVSFAFGQVRKIVSGAGHCMVINSAGSLFSWGCSGYYQTGHQVLSHQLLPLKIEFFESLHVDDASCGISHSLVLAEQKLFTFGDNSHGQCTGNEPFYKSPKEIFSFSFGSNQNIKQVAAGGAHSMVLMSNGKVFICGLNSSGQLGLGHCGQVCELSEVRLQSCVKIFAGEENSAGLTDDGKVFIWGSNGCGQLGQGHFADVLFPCQIRFGEKVKSVSLGVSAVGVVGESDALYWTGYIGPCLKKGDKDVVLDKKMSTPQHYLAQAKIPMISLGRTHCLAYIEKILYLDHNDSVENIEFNIRKICDKPVSMSQIDSEGEILKPVFNIETQEEVLNELQIISESPGKRFESFSSDSNKNLENFDKIEKVEHVRDKSLDSRYSFNRNKESALVTLLSFQKAKEEGREMVKNFRLFEDHFKLPPANLKPASDDKLIQIDRKSSKKLQKIKSMDKEKLSTYEYVRESTGSNFFPNIAQTFNLQQQRLKELEYLANHYDKKLMRYSKPLSPKIKNVKVSKRVGGGYVG